MALFKPYKITSDKLADLPVREGQIVITTDTKKLYVDISATERIEVTSDAEVDLTDYVTTTMLTSALGEEASEREKQDGLLEDLVNTKLDTSSADNRYALKNNPELTGDVSITNAGWALGKITAAHPNNDDANLTYYKYVIGFDSLHRPYFAKYEGETKVSTIYLSSDSVILDQPINFTDASGVGSNSSAANQTRINIGAAAASHTHDLASSFVDGFMSSEDKVKLNNLDSTISAAVSAEATERQQQDTALENAIDEKIGQDNILAGDNINLLKDGINNVTISADSYYAGNGIEENEHTFSLKIQDTNLNAYVGQETEGFILMPHSTTEDGLYGHSIPYDSEIFTGGSSNCFTIKDGGITAEKIADGVIPEVKDVTLASLGVTATAKELNYVDGVTSNIQNQLNNKAAASHTHDDRYYTETEVDNLLANKSNTGHTHTAANITDLDDAIAEQIPDIPTELPNPEALTISLNGTSQGAYNGSAAKSINITAASVGAAASTHNHAASAITSGTFALDRIPIITDGKIQSVSASKITGTIPSSVLPSYVDDVLEYNGTSNFPDTGETGKIYVDTSTNKTYRWGGSDYVEISASLALGTTSSTAFRGDYGNTAYTHATAKGSAFSSGLYKITTNSQGHVTAATAVTKNDITALGIPAQDTNTNTTYELTKSGSTITLEGSDGSSTSVTDSNTVYTHPTTSGNKHIPAGGSSGQILRWSADGTAAWGADNNTNTTYTLSKSGSTITLTGSDGSKTSVTDANTTYSLGSFGVTASAAELNKLDGCTATVTELNYVDGVTSNIQNQLNNKAAASHTHDDRYYTETEVDNLLANKSNTGHTHTAANITDLDDAIAEQIPDIPTELPNPEALTISLNGTSQGAYNGSAAKSINITAASVGAAASTHNHAASAITSGTFALDRIPIITDGKIQSVSASKITGTIPSSVLPSYVDDVLEYNGTSNFPDTGETGKIYVDTSTNKTYRWGGSDYVEISASLALGTTSSTAFRGDYGNTAYTHATAKGSAFSSGLYKITTNSQGHVTAATAVTKNDITALGIPAQDTNTNTTYELTKSGSTITLEGSDGSSTSVTDSNTVYTHPTTSGNKHIPAGGSSGQILRWSADGTAAWGADNNTNTTYTLSKSGSTITLTGSDGSKTSVTDANTTYSLGSFGVTASAAELNKLDGCTATVTELNYVDGVTSNIQTQLNGKLSTSGTAAAATKLATARTIGLSGDASGSVSFNGTANVNIPATVLRHGATTIPANANLNSYTDPGWYYCPANATATTQTNKATSNAYAMLVLQHAGTMQLVFEYMTSDYKVFIRNNYDGSWGAWQRIYTTSNKPTASEIGAAASSHSHSNYLTTSGTAAAATKLATARTFSLTGDVTGSASFNGTANCSIATTLAANSVTANEIASGAVGLSELSSAVGTVAVQSSTPTDSHVKLWIKV